MIESLRAGDDELHVAVLELLERRVEHPVALHAADADARRSGPANGIFDALSANDAASEREHVGVVLLVGGDDVDEDLDFVLEAFREERADRAVDDAALQDLGVVRAAFALDEAAGDLAGGVGLFLVLDE